MDKGIILGAFRVHPIGGTTIVKKGDCLVKKVVPFYCKNCGYIELFIERLLPRH